MKTITFLMTLLVLLCAVQTSSAWGFLAGLKDWFANCLPWAKNFIEELKEKCWNGDAFGKLKNYYSGLDIDFEFDLEGAYNKLKSGFEAKLGKVSEYCDSLDDIKAKLDECKEKLASRWTWKKQQWENKKSEYVAKKQQYKQKLAAKMDEVVSKVKTFIEECGYKKDEVFSCLSQQITEETVCGINTANMGDGAIYDLIESESSCAACFGDYAEAGADIGKGAVKYLIDVCLPYLTTLAEGKVTWDKYFSNDDKSWKNSDVVAVPAATFTNSIITWAIVALLVFNAAIVGYLCWNRNGRKVAYKSVDFETDEESV